ncbi:hypothetical protein IV203_024447 [Nitzschia inconspicua]|uniref:Uncharacterized protein n=1 Tax=Nitzschia inconspicua TaxID=303405 RepID=A0A9K3PDB9_9STRA|nr:hypothetical protein IV203_024447 [Nitzschia inconspicua]
MKGRRRWLLLGVFVWIVSEGRITYAQHAVGMPETDRAVTQLPLSSSSTNTMLRRGSTNFLPTKEEEEEEQKEVASSSSTTTTPERRRRRNQEQQQQQQQGSLEIISDIDPDELQRCLQRRDLEEVFGLDMGVVCTCITANTVTTDSDNNSNNTTATPISNNNNSTTATTITSSNDTTTVTSTPLPSSSLTGTTTVQIVVRLTCTDDRSRFNTGGVAGQFAFCLPKDEPCDHDVVEDENMPNGTNSSSTTTTTSSTSQQQCCGDRICHLQRKQCVAPPSSTSVRSGQNVRLGQGQNGSHRGNDNDTNNEDHDDDDDDDDDEINRNVGGVWVRGNTIPTP